MKVSGEWFLRDQSEYCIFQWGVGNNYFGPHSDFIHYINEKIKLGYKCLGAPFFDIENRLCQAMIKNT